MALEHGIAPVAVGLVAASSSVIAAAIDYNPAGWAVTLAAALVLSVTKLRPLLVVSAGA